MNPTIDKRLAKSKLDRITDELNSGKLYLTCGRHSYVAYVKQGGVTPPEPRGCPDCWKAYYFTLHCITAPHQRYEHLEELNEVIRKTVEMVEKGKFDFVPDAVPDVRIFKDAADDETGKDKIILTEDIN